MIEIEIHRGIADGSGCTRCHEPIPINSVVVSTTIIDTKGARQHRRHCPRCWPAVAVMLRATFDLEAVDVP